MTTSDDPIPATAEEGHLAADMLREVVAVLAKRRRDKRIVVTKRQRESLGPTRLRVGMDRDGTVIVGLLPADDSHRVGVTYLVDDGLLP